MIFPTYELLHIQTVSFSVIDGTPVGEIEDNKIRYHNSILESKIPSNIFLNIEISLHVNDKQSQGDCKIICKFQIHTPGYNFLKDLPEDSDAQRIIARAMEISFFVMVGIFKTRAESTALKNYHLPIKNTFDLNDVTNSKFN